MLLWLLRLKKGRRFQPGVFLLLPILGLGLTIVVIIGAPAVVVSELNDGVDNSPGAVSGGRADGLVGSSVPWHPPEDAAPAPRGSCDVSSPAKSTRQSCPHILGALPA